METVLVLVTVILKTTHAWSSVHDDDAYFPSLSEVREKGLTLTLECEQPFMRISLGKWHWNRLKFNILAKCITYYGEFEGDFELKSPISCPWKATGETHLPWKRRMPPLYMRNTICYALGVRPIRITTRRVYLHERGQLKQLQHDNMSELALSAHPRGTLGTASASDVANAGCVRD